MIKKVTRKIVYNALWLFYPFTFLIQRNKNLWLFGTNFNIYNDNPKYLFEFVSKNKLAIHAVWISSSKKTIEEVRAKGLKAESRYSIKGMYLAARAGVYVYSHEVVNVNLWLKRGAFKLNTWHGVGLKKVGADQGKGKASRVYNPITFKDKFYTAIHSPQVFDLDFHMLATSEITRKNYSISFRIPKENFVIAGYPRLMPFFEKSSKPKTWESYKKVIFYMPTFRDLNPKFLTAAIPKPEVLNAVCKKENILFLFKLHPFTDQNEASRFERYSNLEVLNNSIDTYPLMQHTDAIITDYSSVFIDYAILKKPILIYAYDYLDYVSNARDLYFDFNELTGSKQIEAFDILLEKLADLKSASINVNNLIEIFWSTNPKMASQDITEYIENQLA